jgi:predicted PurR-regulated permease PerM
MSRVRTTDFYNRGEPLLLLAVIILTLFFARELLIPLAFALTLTFLLAPAVSRLERYRVPRVIAVALVVIVVFAGVGAVGFVVSRQLLNVAQTLPDYRTNIQKRMASLHSPTERSLEKALDAVNAIGGDLATSAASSVNPAKPEPPPQRVRVVDPAQNQIQATADLLLTVLRPVGVILVVVVFTIYLLIKREELRNRLLILAGMGHINLMTQAIQDAATRISQYLLLQFAVNATYGVLFGCGLYVIGVPNATLWGVISGILRIVPYVGTATSLVLPLVVSIAVSNTWVSPVLVIVLFLTLELSIANFIEPWLYGTHTGISSLALLATAIFWAILWGWPGLVLSTPLTVCMVVLGRYVPQMSFLHTLLGTEAELSAEAHFYERLLAMDQNGAHTITDRFLTDKSLVALYDSVFIPALSLAEQDRHKGALDEAHSNFLFLSIGELLAELTDYQQKDPEPPAPNSLRHTPNEFAIICVSASDQADELAALMLAQVMERAGHPTLLLNASTVSSEILEGLSDSPDTVLFISALPPFAFSQARALCYRFRAHLHHNRIVIGFWNTSDDPEQTIERFGSGRPNVVVSTLAQALDQVTQWKHTSVREVPRV